MKAVIRVMVVSIVAICLLTTLVGCGKRQPAPTVDVTGLWAVNYKNQSPPRSKLTLKQDKRGKVTGTFEDFDKYRGKIEGNVSGTTLKYVHLGYPQDYRLKVECTVSGNSLSGRWSDINRKGDVMNGTRQWGPGGKK